MFLSNGLKSDNEFFIHFDYLGFEQTLDIAGLNKKTRMLGTMYNNDSSDVKRVFKEEFSQRYGYHVRSMPTAKSYLALVPSGKIINQNLNNGSTEGFPAAQQESEEVDHENHTLPNSRQSLSSDIDSAQSNAMVGRANDQMSAQESETKLAISNQQSMSSETPENPMLDTLKNLSSEPELVEAPWRVSSSAETGKVIDFNQTRAENIMVSNAMPTDEPFLSKQLFDRDLSEIEKTEIIEPGKTSFLFQIAPEKPGSEINVEAIQRSSSIMGGQETSGASMATMNITLPQTSATLADQNELNPEDRSERLLVDSSRSISGAETSTSEYATATSTDEQGEKQKKRRKKVRFVCALQ